MHTHNSACRDAITALLYGILSYTEENVLFFQSLSFDPDSVVHLDLENWWLVAVNSLEI